MPTKRTLALAVLVCALVAAALTTRVQPTPSGVPWWSDRAAIRRGTYDFATGSCISCHALAGVSNADAAVDLTHEGRRRSPTWLAHEIAHPTSDRPATPRGQSRDLAAYLASLR